MESEGKLQQTVRLISGVSTLLGGGNAGVCGITYCHPLEPIKVNCLPASFK